MTSTRAEPRTSDTEVATSPFKKHDYDIPYKYEATQVERKVDGVGHPVWEFSAPAKHGGFTLTVNSAYDRAAYQTLPADLCNLQPQVKTPCSIDVFWCWRKPVGRQTKDQARVIDVQVRYEHTPGPIATTLIRESREKAARAALTNTNTCPAERDYWWEGDTNFYPWEGDVSELDLWFPRDKKGQPVDDPRTDELNAMLEKLVGDPPDDGDELTTPVWSAKESTDPKEQEKRAFYQFKREILINHPKADVSEELLNALSGIPLGAAIAKHGIAKVCDYLQRYLEVFEKAPTSHENEPAALPIPATPIQSNSDEKLSVKDASKPMTDNPMNEAAFVVLFSLWTPIGVEMKYTVRAMSADELDQRVTELVRKMMDKGYKPQRDMPNPMYNVPPASNVTPLPQPATPTLPPPPAQPSAQASGGPDSAGHVPGQTGMTTITGVKVVKDEGKTIIELWAGGQYAEHRLQQPTEHMMVERLTDWAALEVGTKYPVNWISDWVVSTKRAQKGKQNYYLNVTGIRAAQAQAA